MTTCFKCGKILPGNLCPGEYVLCKECAEWFNPNHIKIKVPKFDAKTLDVSVKLERKVKHHDDEKQD